MIAAELDRIRRDPATAEELHRAKENLKGRIVLALESTGARMNRLGSEVLAEAPLLSLDEVTARIDAVTRDQLAELAEELWASPAALGGRDRTRPGGVRDRARGPRGHRPSLRWSRVDPRRGRRGRGADGGDGLPAQSKAPTDMS